MRVVLSHKPGRCEVFLHMSTATNRADIHEQADRGVSRDRPKCTTRDCHTLVQTIQEILCRASRPYISSVYLRRGRGACMEYRSASAKNRNCRVREHRRTIHRYRASP